MAAEVSPPLPSPPIAPASSPLLPAEINVATQKQHIVLNRLIIDRLGLALPPHTQDPTLLGYGLAAFAQIYSIFEEEWTKIEQSRDIRSSGIDGNERSIEILSYLASLRPEKLHRSHRLQRDLDHISRRSGKNLTQLAPRADPRGEIRSLLQAKPHVHLAYAWVMYMAIFSGGRWMRQQLADAGPEFWNGQTSGSLDEKYDMASVGFSFLSFDSLHDGEDIKALFKSRLVQADTLLNAAERQDVIEAAQQLFGHCIELIGKLDRTVARRQTIEKLPRMAAAAVMILVLLVLFLRSTRFAY